MFLRLKGVDGESKSPRHVGEIEISSLSWSSNIAQGHGTASGGGFGKALINDLSFTKSQDRTSAIFMLATSTGQNFAEGTLTMEDFTELGGLMRQIVFELTSVLVSSFFSKNPGIGEATVMDTISLTCGGIKLVLPKI